MDMQVVHAVAPDAKIVLANARPTVEGRGLREVGPIDGGGRSSIPAQSGVFRSAGAATGCSPPLTSPGACCIGGRAPPRHDSLRRHR